MPRIFPSAAIPVLLTFALVSASQALGQSSMAHTADKVDQTLRGNARINPSTLAVEMSVPIADMPGRGGASMPLVFQYSSKVWELSPAGLVTGEGQQMEVRPMYAWGSGGRG